MNKEKEEEKFYSLLKDSTFKYMIKNEKTRKFFFDIIKFYTDLDLKDYTFVDNESNSGGKYADFRFDILLESPDHLTLVNIEMNGAGESYILDRNRVYLHRIAGHFIKEGESYKQLPNKFVRQINFNDFQCKENKNLITHDYMLRDVKNNLVINNFKIYNIYLANVKKRCYNEMEKRLRLLTCESFEEMREVAGDNEEMNYVVDKLDELTKDMYFRMMYSKEEDQEHLMITERGIGYEEGHLDGEKEKSIQIAKRMKSDGIKPEDISKYTSLSIEEIENL